MRKVAKNKGVCHTDTDFEKLIYLVYRNIREKRTMPLTNWAQISQQLRGKSDDRFKII
ncbi:hypothetical protein HMPREF1990_01991 [Porphyromonas gingivalis W4087]|nr:hypothetical protein HMPREF1990_01991 [Porphyromonas gingivalis W4087]